jgi:hypothetical protein
MSTEEERGARHYGFKDPEPRTIAEISSQVLPQT